MPNDAAKRFGALVTRLASAAGYDMERGGNGRAQLAKDTGMSVSAVGRMIRGDTLPELHNFQNVARAVGVTTRDLLVEANLIPDKEEPDSAKGHVRSLLHPLTPEAVADMYGITNPVVRQMLIANIEQAIKTQRDIDQHGTNGGPAVARG